ncbi:MAG: MaoC family dehydratase [Dethiobacteria bacterium]
MVNNKSFEEIMVGDKASFSKTISESDIYTFAGITGDFNPVHINEVAAARGLFKKRVAHGMLSASLISTVLGTGLPGPNTIYLSQEIQFKAPVYIGDTLTAEVEVLEKDEKKNIITLRTLVVNQDGKIVVDGQAKTMKR